MVGDSTLRYGTLFLYQEAEPSPLFRESCLIAIRDVVFQFALLVADGFDVLEQKEELPSPLCPPSPCPSACCRILRRGISDAATGLARAASRQGARRVRRPPGHAHVCLCSPSNPPLLIERPLPRRGADSARGPGAARAAGRAVPRAAALSPNGRPSRAEAIAPAEAEEGRPDRPGLTGTGRATLLRAGGPQQGQHVNPSNTHNHQQR